MVPVTITGAGTILSLHKSCQAALILPHFTNKDQQLVQVDTTIEEKVGFEPRQPSISLSMVAHCMHSEVHRGRGLGGSTSYSQPSDEASTGPHRKWGARAGGPSQMA